MAGRPIGYAQFALAIIGMVLTTVFGVRFVVWYVANWNRLHGAANDPLGALAEMWLVLRWAVLGIGVFFIGWIWALATSFQIVLSSDKGEQKSVPPRLGPSVAGDSTSALSSPAMSRRDEANTPPETP